MKWKGKIIMRVDIYLIKFLLVGLINTAVGAGVMFILYNLVHCSYWISSCCNYIAGGIISFFLNKHFTFKNTERSLKTILLFIANLFMSYFIAYIVAKWFIYEILTSQNKSTKDNFAMLIGMCLYTALNYIGQKYIFLNKGVENG